MSEQDPSTPSAAALQPRPLSAWFRRLGSSPWKATVGLMFGPPLALGGLAMIIQDWPSDFVQFLVEEYMFAIVWLWIGMVMSIRALNYLRPSPSQSDAGKPANLRQATHAASVEAAPAARLLGDMTSVVVENRFLEETRYRLSQQTVDLARRGNLNLVLGMMIAITGLAIIGNAVLTSTTDGEASVTLFGFVPRFAFGVFIQVFAYFFLSLYKQALSEIKYFQNEMTNVEARLMALELCRQMDDPVLQARIVERMAETERNFILSKGQTTVDLERERHASAALGSITRSVGALLNSRDGGHRDGTL